MNSRLKLFLILFAVSMPIVIWVAEVVQNGYLIVKKNEISYVGFETRRSEFKQMNKEHFKATTLSNAIIDGLHALDFNVNEVVVGQDGTLLFKFNKVDVEYLYAGSYRIHFVLKDTKLIYVGSGCGFNTKWSTYFSHYFYASESLDFATNKNENMLAVFSKSIQERFQNFH